MFTFFCSDTQPEISDNVTFRGKKIDKAIWLFFLALLTLMFIILVENNYNLALFGFIKDSSSYFKSFYDRQILISLTYSVCLLGAVGGGGGVTTHTHVSGEMVKPSMYNCLTLIRGRVEGE